MGGNRRPGGEARLVDGERVNNQAKYNEVMKVMASGGTERPAHRRMSGLFDDWPRRYGSEPQAASYQV